MAATDPITMVHDAIVALAKANTTLTSLVRAGAWITYDGTDRMPPKAISTEAARPELDLRPYTGFGHHKRTAGSLYLKKRWAWWISTGDKRVGKELFPIEWELFKAMSLWTTTFPSLSWEGTADYVKDFRVTSIDDKDLSEGRERTIPGWLGIVVCEADLWLPVSCVS